MPLKIFVLLAGATAYAPWRLVTALVVSGLSLGLGARYLLARLRLAPAMLLRAGG